VNVLLIGSGGREHAIAWKLAQSHRLGRLYTMPGNPGTAGLGENLPGSVNDFDRIINLAREKSIDLVVVGPEDPLAAGLADRLAQAGVPTFGPHQAAARLEGSKAFAKDFMARHAIPTGGYKTFRDFGAAFEYFTHLAPRTSQLPVIKVSGLAAGKGVILPVNLSEAEMALREIMVEGRFGDAGAEVVIEERLMGREVSILAFSDGKTVLPLLPAQDHKRLLDGDQGPNTGGMGVFAPSPYCPSEFVARVTKSVLQPAVDGLAAEGTPFLGVLFAGLMMTETGPKVLEFNCRFGDPETQAVLPLLDGDLLEIMLACVDGRLADAAGEVRWKDAAAVCVVLASGGYPASYPKGLPIRGLDALPVGVLAFHAGTSERNGQILTNGGRVLGLTALGESFSDARHLAYEAVSRVEFEGMHFRRDIGGGAS